MEQRLRLWCDDLTRRLYLTGDGCSVVPEYIWMYKIRQNDSGLRIASRSERWS